MKSKFEQAKNAAKLVLDQMSDPVIYEISWAIFLANPPIGLEHGKQLLKACKKHHTTPDRYLERMWEDEDSRRILLDAVNASHEVVGARFFTSDEFDHQWLPLICAIANDQY